MIGFFISYLQIRCVSTKVGFIGLFSPHVTRTYHIKRIHQQNATLLIQYLAPTTPTKKVVFRVLPYCMDVHNLQCRCVCSKKMNIPTARISITDGWSALSHGHTYFLRFVFYCRNIARSIIGHRCDQESVFYD